MQPHHAKRVLVAGEAKGEVASSRQMLSFWGGMDPATGTVIDRRHSLCGSTLAHRIVVLPKGKGSSTGSYVLLDAWVNGCGPAGIILNHTDEIISLGAVVHQELNEVSVPVFVLDDTSFELALNAIYLEMTTEGTVNIHD